MTMPLHSSLQFNMNYLKNMFSNSVDLYSKQIQLVDIQCCLFMFEGLSSINHLWLAALTEIVPCAKHKITDCDLLFAFIKKQTDLPVENVKLTDFEQIRQYLTAGATVIFIDGCSQALAFSTQDMHYRSIQEPSGEGNIRGPREAFSENLRINISLVRRLVRTSTLTVHTLTIGSRTKTEVAVLYDGDLADLSFVIKIKEKLNKIEIPILFDPAYLASFLQKGAFSFFHHVGYTERPATAGAKICEGKIIIMVNGSPFSMILPYTFSENFQSLDDYTNKAYFSSFIRFIKYTAFYIAVLLPGVFISIVEYTPELLPAKLLYKIISAEINTPIPIFLETILVIILLELIREAGLRLPRPIGHTVGLVSALIIGETAIKAGLLSTPVVVTAALTTISMLVTPSLYEAGTILRLLFVFFAGLMGPAGIIAMLYIMQISICNMDSFGVSYASPFAPLNQDVLKDGIVRQSWNKLAKSPFSINQISTRKSHK